MSNIPAHKHRQVGGTHRDLIERMIDRGLTAQRDYATAMIDVIAERLDGKIETGKQRLDDMDRATALLSETVNRVPTDVQKAVGDVMRVMDERDHRIQNQFEAIRILRESQHELSQQAIKDALIAQKESSAVSARSLDRAIGQNAELADEKAKSLDARMSQLSEQQVRNQQSIAEIQASKAAVVEQKTDTRQGAGTVISIVAIMLSVLTLITTIVIAIVLRS